MRIAHYLARCGVASRRKSEEIVLGGRVALNGEVITDLGRQVRPGEDLVEIDGRKIELKTTHVTLAFNKPREVVVTRDDPEQRRTVYDLLPEQWHARAAELVYCGRLDYHTSGLLIMTTDGALANRLMHPSHSLEKEYRVLVDREVTSEELESIRAGIEIDGYKTRPALVERISAERGGVLYRVVLGEGRNRQVRRMMEVAGVKVRRLERVRIGALKLGELGLRHGEWKELGDREIELLFRERV